MIPAAFRLLLLGALLGLPAAVSAAPASKRAITLEDLSRLREVGDPRMSPDGAWVAYTVRTHNLAADERQRDLWIASWDGATSTRLTTTE